MDQIFLIDSQQKKLKLNMANKMKINDTISSILAYAGIIMAYFEYEEFYGSIVNSNETDVALRTYKDQYIETPLCRCLRIIIGISSLLLCISVSIHYILKLEFLKLKQKVDAKDNLFTTKLIWFMISEIIVCIVHCPSGCNWVFTFEQYGGSLEYSFDMFTFLFMLSRVYLIWRIFEHYSSWNDEESEEICNSCLCEGGVKFAIKAELKERPYTVVISVLFISIMFFGAALRTAERPFMKVSGKDWDYIWNGMWCIIITMATVGYGDFYPTTHLGRVVDVIACFWGTFLVSLMVLSLTISSELTPQERKAYDIIKKKEAKLHLEVSAANTIKSAIRLRIFLKRNPFCNDKTRAGYVNKFKNSLIKYRTIKRKIKAKEQDAPFEYILAKLNEKVSYGLEDIKSKCFVYKTLLARLDTSETNQQMLKTNIEALKEANNAIMEKLCQLKKLKAN